MSVASAEWEVDVLVKKKGWLSECERVRGKGGRGKEMACVGWVGRSGRRRRRQRGEHEDATGTAGKRAWLVVVAVGGIGRGGGSVSSLPPQPLTMAFVLSCFLRGGEKMGRRPSLLPHSITHACAAKRRVLRVSW